jgi:glyoxylase-like metal-dependent hydrolase (beta-lactamase superfamily II)
VSVKQLLPGLWKVFFPSLSVHAFLLSAGDGVTVIDTGRADDGKRLRKALAKVGLEAGDVRRVLVTHYHSDHVGNLAALVGSSSEAKVYGHAADAGVVREGGEAPKLTPTPGMGKVFSLVIGPFIPKTSDAAPVHVEVTDGDEIPGSGGLRVIHTPGHTPGHVSFLWPEHGGVLFVGDLYENDLGSLSDAIGHEDIAESHRSLRKVADMGGFDVAVFGHGRPIVGGATEKTRKLADKLKA